MIFKTLNFFLGDFRFFQEILVFYIKLKHKTT